MIEASGSCEEIEEIMFFALLFLLLCKAVTCVLPFTTVLLWGWAQVSCMYLFLSLCVSRWILPSREEVSLSTRGWFFMVGKFKKAKGYSITMFQYLQDGCRESGGSLFTGRDEG